MRKFLKEEKAQGAIEYILLAGGIIVAAVVIFAIYSSMTKSSMEQLNTSTAAATAEMNRTLTNAINNM